MPYIKPEIRKNLDGEIDKLVEKIVEEAQKDDPKITFVGILNYTLTTISLKTVKKLFGQMRYWLIASLVGLFHNIADEFYRRVGSSYENKQIEKSGDVEVYQDF
ncbi:MAG: DUF6899 family protein [Minisyncoccia bacterium]